MPTESTMRCERSKPLKVNREDIGLPVRKACGPIPVSIDPIDLWPKVAGKNDRAIASIAVLLTMRPRLSF
jgi:hypothetical protein